MHAVLIVVVIVLVAALASMVSLLISSASRLAWNESAVMAARTFACAVGVATALAGVLFLAL
ncbi:hypothetical protein [Nocardiopsis trehalosi]|uniref:hypothetical protein n=1 Tax=Nocardiopsis trehalosi TaxID=109329 RepID=UPI00082C8A2D|nr:hypothetical protein [Nocardiopsis trehalosi]